MGVVGTCGVGARLQELPVSLMRLWVVFFNCGGIRNKVSGSQPSIIQAICGGRKATGNFRYEGERRS